MQTIELVVYLSLALLVGLLFIGAIKNWDFIRSYNDVRKGLLGEGSDNFEKVSINNFPKAVVNLWKDCGFGELSKELVVYVEGEDSYTKEMLFSNLSKMNYCEIIQYGSFGCGTRDDIVMEAIALPSVVKLRCDSSQRKLYIG